MTVAEELMQSQQNTMYLAGCTGFQRVTDLEPHAGGWAENTELLQFRTRTTSFRNRINNMLDFRGRVIHFLAHAL